LWYVGSNIICGNERNDKNKFITRNKVVEQTKTRKEEKLAGTSIEGVIRKSSQATFILSAERKM
jgi:hypothetical protein